VDFPKFQGARSGTHVGAFFATTLKGPYRFGIVSLPIVSRLIFVPLPILFISNFESPLNFVLLDHRSMGLFSARFELRLLPFFDACHSVVDVGDIWLLLMDLGRGTYPNEFMGISLLRRLARFSGVLRRGRPDAILRWLPHRAADIVLEIGWSGSICPSVCGW